MKTLQFVTVFAFFVYLFYLFFGPLRRRFWKEVTVFCGVQTGGAEGSGRIQKLRLNFGWRWHGFMLSLEKKFKKKHTKWKCGNVTVNTTNAHAVVCVAQAVLEAEWRCHVCRLARTCARCRLHVWISVCVSPQQRVCVWVCNWVCVCACVRVELV